ncbi:adhesion G protein-coupled receptor E1-like [Silurus meridionalis]|uniref:adhesion G protein-coupled receptor E1-like n=1 Tax=Silurus meridionalis TaxID=175797 RepID=UPI001EEC97F5|nr:adhesion G protein-coupled receptor E1-like [Silurus meridionalis]
MEIVTFLLKRISVLLLMALITCDTQFDEGLTTPEHCQDEIAECAQELLNQIENKTSQELPQETVENYLNIMMNITRFVKDNTTDQDLLLYGNNVLIFTETLVSKLVRKTDNIQSVNISLQTLEIQVIELGLNSTVSRIPSLTTTTASMDMEFTGIPNNSKVAVALMSYNNMAAILNASFFKSFVSTTKKIMSPVVSVTLPKASGFTTEFSHSQVTFTLKHVDELDPNGVLSCVYWNKLEWVEDGCSIIEMNRTHTLCSCDRLGTFAIIMQTYTLNYTIQTIFITVSAALGMMPLSLSILTFAICRPYKKVTNLVLINLCISLFLAMLVSLLTVHFQAYICPRQNLFAVLEGVLFFFCFSAAVWMFSEAALIFIFVKNLSNVRSNQGEGLSWKWLIAIGFLIPMSLVVVYALAYGRIYTGFICMANVSRRDKFIYFIPFYIIHASVSILFIISIIIIILNLIRIKTQNLQRSNSNDTKLIMSVMFKSMANFFIIGCPWIILFIPTKGLVFYVLELICIQQGTFIFLIHCVFNLEIRQQYRKLLCAICCFNNRSPAAADGQEHQQTM